MTRYLGFVHRMVYAMLGLSFVLLAGMTAHAVEPASLYRNSYALLIGVNEYPKLPKSKWLQYSVNDVMSLQKLLITSYGFRKENVKVLTNNKATLAKVGEALAELADSNNIKKDDRVLIFFSGHGQTVKTSDGGEMGFLLPYDASVKLSDLTNAGPFMRTCLPMSRVWEYLQPCPAKHVLILADVCYSGLLAQSRALEDINIASVQVLAKTPSRQVMTAGGKGQTSVEKSQWGHGAFTYKLLEKLTARTAEPGKVFTAQDLFTEVQRSVSNITAGKQTPQLYNKDTEGEFLFIPTGKVAVVQNNRPVTIPAVVIPDTASGTISPGNKVGDICINPKDGAEMVWVPEGEFLMGSTDAEIAKLVSENSDWKAERFESEKPQHKVYLDGYWIYKNEVTVAQYRKFCLETNKTMPEEPKWGWIDSHPIVNVTWDAAADYAKWAGASLPTEAQWEKAARGTDGRIYPWGNEWDASKCNEQTKGPGMTQPVGSYAAGVSPYGCMDMAGNVWEWCTDWYGQDYYKSASSRNPTGPVSGSFRALRDGSWYPNNYGYYRCAYRTYGIPGVSYFDFGFRLAR